MTFIELLEKISKVRKGTFIKIEYKSVKKPLAAFKGSTIEKYSKGVYRLGITYANMKENQNKVTGALPFGKWEPNLENYIVDYNGKKYLRVYVDSKHKTTSKWFLNGVETTKDYLVDNRIIGAQNKHHTSCFILPIENIISIG